MATLDREALARTDLLVELSKSQTDAERQEFFAHHPEHYHAGLIEVLCRETAHSVAVDLERAIGLATAARWLARSLADVAGFARSTRALANARHSAGDTAAAQELYEEAFLGFSQLGDEREAAITRSSALLNLAYLGRYEQVQAWQQAAHQVFVRLGDQLRLAILQHNYANILYRQDRWAEALELYQQAHAEFVRLERFQDVAICWRNIAVCQISLHRFDEAMAVYHKTRAYCDEHGLIRVGLQVDYNIAYLYYMRGEYTRAIQLFRAARQRCEDAGEEYHKALCDLDQSEIYLELNLVEEAAELAQAAHSSFAQLHLPYEGAKALTNQAIALSRHGLAVPALELLQRAREIFVCEQNQLWPALVDFYQAVVLARAHRPREAMALAGRAREVFAAFAMASRAAMCDLLRAELLLELGQPGQAREACHGALHRLAELQLPALEYQAHLVLGRVEEASHDPFAALAAYQASHRRLEALRSQLQGEDLKIAFLEDKQVVYESLVWLTLKHQAGPTAETLAFDYIEQAKSRSLADLLAFRAPALPPRQPRQNGLASRVGHLREELNWAYRQIDHREMEGGEHPRANLQQLRERVHALESELLRALRELQTADRELSSLQSGGVFAWKTVCASLPATAVLVEYFIARGTIWAVTADQERLEIRAVSTTSRTREIHRLLQFQLSQLALRGESRGRNLALVQEATQAHLEELYRELIAPIRPRLQGRHLIFVPHGFLHYLPFHALFDGVGHLIDQFSISYAPSAGVLHLCAIKEAQWTERSLVFGVADERAPQILEEAKAVAGCLPQATLLTNEAATEEALRQEGAGCRFIHIATHGLFRRDNPMFSAIQLGQTRLGLCDLYDLRLSAELVVLSGCGTGLNAILGADELVGLTRGWLYAGAQTVLVTLWDVNDASTAVFMRCFYQHLADGTPRAQALRFAMLDLREQYPHPYYWAPFVLVGKPDP